jgi:hypothetical protein
MVLSANKISYFFIFNFSYIFFIYVSLTVNKLMLNQQIHYLLMVAQVPSLSLILVQSYYTFIYNSYNIIL